MISSISNTPTSLQPPPRPTTGASPSDAASPDSSPQQTASAAATAKKGATNPQQQSTVPVESTHTRNADGTYGPKHTLRPPISLTGSGPHAPAATSAVNIKV